MITDAEGRVILLVKVLGAVLRKAAKAILLSEDDLDQDNAIELREMPGGAFLVGDADTINQYLEKKSIEEISGTDLGVADGKESHGEADEPYDD